jgi:hypothetical protein
MPANLFCFSANQFADKGTDSTSKVKKTSNRFLARVSRLEKAREGRKEEEKAKRAALREQIVFTTCPCFGL